MQKTVHVELSLASSNIAILPLVSPMYVLGMETFFEGLEATL